MAKKLNERCPLQGECEKVCKFTYRERECAYYQGNSRPGLEIPDQSEASSPDSDDQLLAALGNEDMESAGEEKSADPGKMVYLPILRLSPHPDNPRKDLGDLTELADSIKENGVLQNLTVVQRRGEITGDLLDCYTVIIGHRRLAAAKMAGLKELPCVIVDMTLQDQVRTMLMENIQRTDLTVYEQAQGFQLMLNLGDSVDEIARKSGFSQTTVRRRVKLLELDHDKFKASVDRGATLQDYIELDKVSDPELKNEVLESVGTNNFRSKLQQAIEREKQKKCMDEAVVMLSEFATKVEEIDSAKLQYIRNFSYWNRTSPFEKPEDTDERGYYYRIGSYQVDLYADKVESTANSDAEEERTRAAESFERRRSELREATKRAYQLRHDFVAECTGLKKHLPALLKAAGHFCFAAEEGDASLDYEILADLLGIDCDLENDSFPMDAYNEQMATRPEYTLLATLFASVNDETSGYWDSEWRSDKRTSVLVNAENPLLDSLYEFLQELGYEVSDEELALQDGTHELFEGNGEEDAS